MADLTSIWIWIAAIALGFGAGLITRKTEKKTEAAIDEGIPYEPDPNFLHLTVHYLRIRGVPDNPDSATLKYITDDKKEESYRMCVLPDWLAPAIKEHRIRWHPYDDERVLRRYVTSKYSFVDKDPPLPDWLGLRFLRGSWVEDKPHSELLSKLEGRKLKDLQIADLSRRSLFSHVRRVLLVDFSKKQVWLAPSCCFELIEKGIVESEIYEMHPWQSCKCWSKRKFGFDFISRRYSESQLFAEGA
jgi:hypothetical protein